MKKNLELTHNQKEVKLNKKNYIVILIPIILVIILIVSIAIFVSVTNSPSNKLKSYLEEIGYSCNKKTCSKQTSESTYTINYTDVSFHVDNEIYRLTINSETPALELKNDEFICTYTKADYTRFTLVDDSFIYDKKCSKYISEVNKYIEEYKSIVNSSGIDVNNLDK